MVLQGRPASPAGISFKAKNPSRDYSLRHEKQQLIHRLPAPLIRHFFAQVRAGHLSPQAAALELNLHLSRFYQLRTDYLRACAHGRADTWTPQTSGGDHHPDWPAEVRALLTKLLSSQPPSSYSAAASELHRRLDFQTDRASVRRWAIENKLAPDTCYQAAPTGPTLAGPRCGCPLAIRPHAFLPGSTDKQGLLNLLDDATRYNPGARLYPGRNPPGPP